MNTTRRIAPRMIRLLAATLRCFGLLRPRGAPGGWPSGVHAWRCPRAEAKPDRCRARRPPQSVTGTVAGAVALIVQKYGGTSVADADRIRAVAEHVALTHAPGPRRRRRGQRHGQGDRQPHRPGQRRLDHPARPRDGHAAHHRRAQDAWRCCAWRSPTSASTPSSFTGSQVGIITDNVHGKAKILEVKGDRVRAALADGQGLRRRRLPGRVDRRRRSPPSAGAAPTPPPSRWPRRSGADAARSTPTSPACSPPTPGSCRTARKLAACRFDEMLEMAATGGRVLALRSVEFARNHHVAAARPLQLHLGAGHVGHRGGAAHGRPDHLRRHPRHVGGQGHGHRRARPARHRGARCSAPLADATSTST